MAAATTCVSTSLPGQALDLSNNALAGKVNVGEARLSMKATAKATDSIGYDADAGDCDWDTGGLSYDPDTFTKNRIVNCWQLTMGRLSRSGTIYSYERNKRTVNCWQLAIGRLSRSGTMDSYEQTKDSGYSQAKRSDITVAKYSYQISQQSKEDKKIYLWTERKPRARELNHKMISNINSDGTMTEALGVLKNCLQRGITTDSFTYVKVLHSCLKQKDLLAAKQVHACVIQTGMDMNPYVAGTLMNVYIKCGALVDARRVFDQIETKNVVNWTNMITGYAKSNHAEPALQLFNQMREEGVEPNDITYLSILKACASPLALKWGKQIHECIRHAGFDSDVRVATALLKMYFECGCVMGARQVFENLTKRDVMTWTVMIGGLAQHGCGHEAYRLFCQMRRESVEPDVFTYTSILNASASAGALEWVEDVHGHARKAGLESDMRVGTALVQMYAESGSIDEARVVFERMEKRDVVTWNVMIRGLAQHGCGHEALEYFRKMNADRVKPDEISFVAVLTACCHTGHLDDGRRLFLAMTQDYGIEPGIEHYNCMVDLLGRAGCLDEAKIFISDMPVEANEVTWKALLGACRTYGNVELGELAAKELFKLEPNNAAPYVLLSNIYAGAGKWEKQELVRTMMKERGIRKEPGRSWIEVDKQIHEFVVGDISHPEAKGIYTMLKNLTERLKAEGYTPDTRLVLHNIDETDKELALCSHSEKLAIAYGLMCIRRGEPIRVYKNLRVCSDCHAATKLISKVTGREIIVRDANRFHHFKDGVCSCGDYW